MNVEEAAKLLVEEPLHKPSVSWEDLEESAIILLRVGKLLGEAAERKDKRATSGALTILGTALSLLGESVQDHQLQRQVGDWTDRIAKEVAGE